MEPEAAKSTVMVVDDIPANLRLLEEMLTRRGYRVVEFPGAERALRAALRNPPDLILLDIMMPEVDGFEFCRQLKAEEVTREIPVIFVSALDDTSNKVKGFAAGGVDYVTKPFREEEVEARVGAHLRIVGLQKQLRVHNEQLEQKVAERTRELDVAYKRLLELDRLKDDFLRMISHEIRAPANSFLGIGEILLERCRPSEDAAVVKDIFRQSARRLSDLIEDATLIADMHSLEVDDCARVTLGRGLRLVEQALAKPRITVEEPFERNVLLVCGQADLWGKVLGTMVSLAACFCQDSAAVTMRGNWEPPHYCLRIALDAFCMDQVDADQLFEIEATIRSASPAESLGLGPVVAEKLLTAFGGSLKLRALDGPHGCLEARLPVVHGQQN